MGHCKNDYINEKIALKFSQLQMQRGDIGNTNVCKGFFED
jgi:hypothetical protein